MHTRNFGSNTMLVKFSFKLKEAFGQFIVCVCHKTATIMFPNAFTLVGQQEDWGRVNLKV